ncbi:unnamed protein product [Rotaria socialis]|uniref:Uncharacterized protein n=2 Tax=Rotaria socialis TaxID=392032 RepID=A0A821JIS3_9BILA|nr:unnamed protein product [Rotaria socialis]CAF3295726.1 unnamed protein product [Rotaria socialis]CAF3491053.1 unnamed protein product [Rotaria socialis]CAF3523070.1 unnamed protein product [Rotaria socialis]CAF3551639.1 unnamed protein product [Rotaria socialis]
MATRTGSKQGRQAAKSSLKAPGKDQTKNEKQPTNVLEIVPGKFNETDWLSLLENDDTEDFIADIFEGIWAETSRQIQQLYIRRQLLPFTLMMTENALSNVIQWAFLERDEPKPATGDFWIEDAEPSPSTMDNWGEGVVPACREERPQSVEESPLYMVERPSTAPLTNLISENADRNQRPSTGSTLLSAAHTTRLSSQRKKLSQTEKSDFIREQNKREKSIESNGDHRTATEKELSREKNSSLSSSPLKPYFHDVLVIETQPPKLEPLSDLFYPPQIDAHSSYLDSTPATITRKHRYMPAPKASSQLGSDALASTTNLTGTPTTKSYRKPTESKLFDDMDVEEAISKAPAAAHSMLKSILSRPPGYRELELDDNGNVISITKLDPDKITSRSIRVKCDVISSRKPTNEIRTPPAKPPKKTKSNRLETKFTTVKLVLPEQSTDVGDLIQPVPGVLYEDARLKKGDPRRYQTGLSKYTNFYDESRPLKPIGQRSDLSILQVANELLSQTKDSTRDDDNDRDLQIPKLHRLARIPPIMSGSSTSTT